MMPEKHDLQPIRVWDLPTRLFHWLLVLAVSGAVLAAQVGGDAMAWHFRFGYGVFALLAFRLVWGLVGGRWSRFGSFLYSPAALLRDLRGRSAADQAVAAGHRPLGALSVFAMLAVLLVQVGTGLVADDEIVTTGPLNRFVSTGLGLSATSWHKSWGQWLIYGLVTLHVLAIVFYALRKSNLVRAMLVGDKHLPPGTPATGDTPGQRVLAALVMAACVAGVLWVVRLGG
jgi:cytochrome b